MRSRFRQAKERRLQHQYWEWLTRRRKGAKKTVYYIPELELAKKSRGREHAAIVGGWLEERRRQILLLLQGHARPLDKAATARLMGAAVAQTIRDLDRVRRPALLEVVQQLYGIHRRLRNSRLMRKTCFWPVELTPSVRLDTVGSLDANPVEAGYLTTVELPGETVTENRLRALSARLRKVENPVGLMLAGQLAGRDYAAQLLKHLKMVKVMRGLIEQRMSGVDQ